MADIQLATQTVPSLPDSGSSLLYIDSTTKLLSTKNDNGYVQPVGISIRNNGPNGQVLAANATFVTGSAIQIPLGYPRVGTVYRFKCDLIKTAAGTATPLVFVSYGTSGTGADTILLTYGFSAQTAVADTGVLEVAVAFRNVGAAATIQSRATILHNLAATGLITKNTETLTQTSGTFDSTVANSFFGISINAGTSSAWTIGLAEAELRSY